MKERTIKFSRDEDPTLVSYSDEKKSEILKELKSLSFAASHLHEQLSKGELNEGFKGNLLFLLEANLTSVFKGMDYDSFITKERDERYVEIRQLNNENRSLREQLGDKVTNEDVRERLKNFEQTLRKWWNIEGFGHMSEISFGSFGVELLLSGRITRPYYADGEMTKEVKRQKLIDYGFQFEDETVFDNDKNKELLDKLIKEFFPSGNILEIRSYRGVNGNVNGEIRDIKVYIHNYDDIVYEYEKR